MFDKNVRSKDVRARVFQIATSPDVSKSNHVGYAYSTCITRHRTTRGIITISRRVYTPFTRKLYRRSRRDVRTIITYLRPVTFRSSRPRHTTAGRRPYSNHAYTARPSKHDGNTLRSYTSCTRVYIIRGVTGADEPPCRKRRVFYVQNNEYTTACR